MTDALIGHTGFVGGNLARQMRFDEVYNSRNIEDIKGREFNLVVCAGAPGAKWLANQSPLADQMSILKLIGCLRTISARAVVLISTVDAIRPKDAYSRHRCDLEWFVRTKFRGYVLRLPALFGAGLKKNPIFDLMNDNRLEAIAPNSVYQWYPMRRLAEDIEDARRSESGVVSLLSEPIVMEEVRGRFFPEKRIGIPQKDAPFYSIMPEEVDLWLNKDEILSEMERFLRDAGCVQQPS